MNRHSPLAPGRICHARKTGVSSARHGTPPLFVLSEPQKLPCGLHAVEVVPLTEGEIPPLMDQDLLLFPPHIPDKLGQLVLAFACRESVLAGQLEPTAAKVEGTALSLIAEFWKSCLGAGPRPCPEDYPPPWSWDSGLSMPSEHDIRALRIQRLKTAIAPLRNAYEQVHHEPGLRVLAQSLLSLDDVAEELVIASSLATRELLLSREMDPHICVEISGLLGQRGPLLQRAAGRHAAAGTRRTTRRRLLRPLEHLRELQVCPDTGDRLVHALLSGNEKALQDALMEFLLER